MTITNETRKKFIDYFKKQGHIHVPASSLIPKNDPTLMFTNSGMVQFKNYLSGVEKPPYKRATTYQKSVRAGGKHNDLDNVGYTVRHHTFFEMLGNFSFGDYFKNDAINFAWEFLTKEIELPKDKLYVTIFHNDEEAHDIWKKVAGLSEDRIIRIATKDNFWQMGDTGPCGPCSEIFYDHGDKFWGGLPGTPEEDGDRYIELWNIVFDQFEDLPDGTRIGLKKPSIDTGSGLERLSAVLHGTNDNFAIDVMRGLIENAANIANADPDGPHRNSLRVIADHLRSSAFLIADGILPSNEGRGYVLRRIMRRAMRHAHLMGCKDPLMYKLVPNLNEHMGEVYPELYRAQFLIEETLKLEETRFKQMLDKGLKMLDAEAEKLTEGQSFPGDVAFKLYDTYGFPLDLTQDALRSKNILVDKDGFEKAMTHQREEARKAWAGSGETATEAIWFDLSQKLPATDFLGYSTEAAEGEIIALVKDGQTVSSAEVGQTVIVLTNQTPFYGEMGGQVGDTGFIKREKTLLKVIDTQKKLGKLTLHTAVVEKGSIQLHDTVLMNVDIDRRRRIQAHHSATHLLQAALQKILGKHVVQRGSLVTPDYLRFDFSHSQALTREEIVKVETTVNQMILSNASAKTRLMTPEEAINEGAMALFGEKYGETVRVVSFEHTDECLSIELCGGIHVHQTGDIGLFKITSETAVGAGVRRIEAVVGMAAYDYLSERENIVESLAELLKGKPSALVQKVESLLENKRRLEKQISDMRQKAAIVGSSEGGTEKVTLQGQTITLVEKELTDIPAKDLKGLADNFKKAIKSGIVLLINTTEGKVSIVAAVTDDLTDKISAIDLVKAGSHEVGGQGGGGRPDMAQAGGNDASHVKQAFKSMKSLIK